jgi:CDP-diacylglycerol--serine O-phosphatidyltransferase
LFYFFIFFIEILLILSYNSCGDFALLFYLWVCALHSILKLIPNLFTLGNAICGFAAIVIAAKIDLSVQDDHSAAVLLRWSAGMIFLAMIFDVLDGMLARLVKVTSDFGGQLDSLCDAISFGAAPAFLILRLGQDWDSFFVRNIFACIAGLFMACAIIRLAKYNLENTDLETGSFKRFKGLPSPAAGGCIASLALIRSYGSMEVPGFDFLTAKNVVSVWAVFGAVVVALLMVSPFSYPHLTKHILRKKVIFGWCFALPVIAPMVYLVPESLAILIFWIYALNFPARQIFYIAFRRNMVDSSQASANDYYRR